MSQSGKRSNPSNEPHHDTEGARPGRITEVDAKRSQKPSLITTKTQRNGGTFLRRHKLVTWKTRACIPPTITHPHKRKIHPRLSSWPTPSAGSLHCPGLMPPTPRPFLPSLPAEAADPSWSCRNVTSYNFSVLCPGLEFLERLTQLCTIFKSCLLFELSYFSENNKHVWAFTVCQAPF